MKKTFYVYEVVKSLNSIHIQGKIKMFTQEVLSLRNDQFHNLLGTIELDVQPIRKEVEKVMDVKVLHPVSPSSGRIYDSLPLNAYNVKVSYTVKECDHEPIQFIPA